MGRRYWRPLPDTPDTVILSYEVGVVKPDPAIFRLVCDRLGLQPEEIQFVGDTPSADVEGPRAIGMSAILIADFEAYLDRQVYPVGDLPEDIVALIKAAIEAAESGSGPQQESPYDPAEPTLSIMGSGLGPLVSLEEGEALLDEITVDDDSTDWTASELLSGPMLAERLQVSLATLDAWRTANKAIAFPSETGEYVYPVRQLDGTEPVDGLDRVVEFFSSPDEAWEWLVTPCRYTNDEAPIDRLRSKHTDEVVRAAQGVNDFQ